MLTSHRHRCLPACVPLLLLLASCIIGLPERGKPYIARRLQSYLSFFHGAEVQIFNLQDYDAGVSGSDENADALLKDLRAFMGRENHTAANNMKVAKQPDKGRTSLHRRSASGEEDREEAGPSAAGAVSDAVVAQSMLVDNKDPRRKNVDSGKVRVL